jgi:DNA-binding MarR family transcriptional regulator
MDDEVASRIGHAWRELRRGASMAVLRERMQGEIGLDLGQIDFLEHLVLGGAARMSDLAETLRVDASTATRAVQRLVDRGLAARAGDPRDARCVMVEPTADGRALHEELAASRQAAMRELLAGFTAAERRQLADGMERLVAALDEFVAERATPAAS